MTERCLMFIHISSESRHQIWVIHGWEFPVVIALYLKKHWSCLSRFRDLSCHAPEIDLLLFSITNRTAPVQKWQFKPRLWAWIPILAPPIHCILIWSCAVSEEKQIRHSSVSRPLGRWDVCIRNCMEQGSKCGIAC